MGDIQCPSCGELASVLGWKEPPNIHLQVTCEWCEWEGFQVNMGNVPLSKLKNKRAYYEATLIAAKKAIG